MNDMCGIDATALRLMRHTIHFTQGSSMPRNRWALRRNPVGIQKMPMAMPQSPNRCPALADADSYMHDPVSVMDDYLLTWPA